MVLFLSKEWIAALDRLLRAQEPPADLPAVVIEQRIETEDSDGLSYQVALGPEGCRASSPGSDIPTITYLQSRATAEAIACGERTAHEAFMLGDLRVEGDPNQLVEAIPAMEWLGPVLEPLHLTTRFV